MSGTIKEALRDQNQVGLLKIRSFRPFPGRDIARFAQHCQQLVIMEKATSSGAYGPLYSDVMAHVPQFKGVSSDHIVGLGGRDISVKIIHNIIKSSSQAGLRFW